eukprot:g43089.t1
MEQLVGLFADIFNLSLLPCEVPTCFKKTTVIPVPSKNQAACLNDYCPLALISFNLKSFERLVMAHINSSLPDCFDPLQFAYWHNRSTTDAISLTLHSPLEHLDNKNTYVRVLFIDYTTCSQHYHRRYPGPSLITHSSRDAIATAAGAATSPISSCCLRIMP